eukprot:CAMPEP_0118641210 /NCGR_PEP_ID=MMETSP0785-20121206/5158_1 /TAXON_ID=91992 /ORGANISM="Bolidomonas pacifica, Strain CCMP 1866" /LENGTH=1516 /DNA_ID=CAMNT_0006532635 /DNA_START=2314 /DNA_END=6861 /DNA_ORIENTATION=+
MATTLPIPSSPSTTLQSQISTCISTGFVQFTKNTSQNKSITILPYAYESTITSRNFNSTAKSRSSFLRLLSLLHPTNDMLASCASIDSSRSHDPSLRGRDFYKIIDNVSIDLAIGESQPDDNGEYKDEDFVNPQGLVPKLRWYQQKAYNWMIERESSTRAKTKSWKLMWIPLAPGLVYNPFFKIACRSWEDAEAYLPPELTRDDVKEVKGGLLAEQMGLGKTVEVLALVQGHKRPEDELEENIEVGTVKEEPIKLDEVGVEEGGGGRRVKRVKTEGEEDFTNLTTRVNICLCGLTKKKTEDWVVCKKCKQHYHRSCIEEETGSEGLYCSPATQCLTCIAEARSSDGNKFKSKSTLIVTPRPLTSQWIEEIKRHTTGLSVCIYEGVKEAGKRGQAGMLLSNPIKLGQHDIVLTTFEVLKEDLNHSDFNPYSAASGRREGRGGKRKLYPILPSPLTSIDWWRVCIDEAQRVATPTAKSAMMALRLKSFNKWAVTGTPVAKNKMADIFGLLLFLDQAPWNDISVFKAYFNGNTNRDQIEKRIRKVFGDVMWRSTKTNKVILKQLNVPQQREKVHLIEFQPIEKAVYDRHFKDIKPAVRSLVNTLSSSTYGKVQKEAASVANLISRLRTCCSHPSIGSHGMGMSNGGGGGKKKRSKDDGDSKDEGKKETRPMTMLQIASKLVQDAKEKCREDQTTVVYHLNAQASFYRLNYIYRKDPTPYNRPKKGGRSTLYDATEFIDPPQLSSSELKGMMMNSIHAYENVLKLQNTNAPLFKYDTLQRIHALHNLLRVLKEGGITHGQLQHEQELEELKAKYMGGRQLIWVQTKKALQDDELCYKEEVTKLMSLTHTANSPWWLDALKIIKSLTTTTNRLAETFIPFVETSLANMLVNSGGGAFLQANSGAGANSTSSSSKRNKRQELVAAQRTENRNAAGFHDNLNMRFEDLESMIQEVESYTSTFNVEERYLRLSTSNEMVLLKGLVNPPPASDVVENGNCRTCRREARKTGPSCSHCTLQALLEKKRGALQDKTFLTILDALQKFIVSMISGVGVAAAEYEMKIVDKEVEGTKRTEKVTEWTRVNQGTSREPLHPFNLQAMPSLQKLDEVASSFEKMRVQAMKMLTSMFAHHESHQNLMGGLDELRECVTTARLRLVGEYASYSNDLLTENGESLPTRIAQHKMQFQAALAELSSSKKEVSYLCSLREKEESNSNEVAQGGAPETCMICLEEFAEERALLLCGHTYHAPCLEQWVKKGKGAGMGSGQDVEIECVLRCQRKTRRKEVLFSSTKEAAEKAAKEAEQKAALKKAEGASKETRSREPSPAPLIIPMTLNRAPLLPSNVIGARNYGSKISKLIQILLDIRDDGEKALVLSLYDQTISIINDALNVNGIKAHSPKPGGKNTTLGKVIDRWRKDDSTALCFNIRQGAEGLTLVEGSHVFIVDPILNSGLDHQAISRIHRIGQDKETTVHRFIMKGTVEEILHAERKERMVALESGEIDADELKNGEVIKGQDSGFTVDELKR